MTCDLALRPGTAADATPCAALHQGWLDATPWMPRLHDLAETTDWMRMELFPESEVIVAEIDAAVRAFVALGPTSIVLLAVAEGWRSRGVGSRLLDHAKGLRPRGLTLWTFEANERARRFYARHGFVELQRTSGDNAEGLPDVMMGWAGHA